MTVDLNQGLIGGVNRLFPLCFPPVEYVQGVARLTEARLSRDMAEGRVIDFRRSESTGFEVIRTTAITETRHKVMYVRTYTVEPQYNEPPL